MNVKQVHVLEPYWNEVRIEQVIGRAVRQCHHKDLPLKERTVDVFRYKMIRNKLVDKTKPDIKKIKLETSDEFMENISRKKRDKQMICLSLFLCEKCLTNIINQLMAYIFYKLI